jgi:hypothetical protein
MSRLHRLALVFLVASPLLGGCVYREVRPPRPEHCRYQEWIPGHRDHAGYWHEGHWRCD